jgi:hypothetical protein
MNLTAETEEATNHLRKVLSSIIAGEQNNISVACCDISRRNGWWNKKTKQAFSHRLWLMQ